MPRPLVIFTHYYPFGDLELFLETEILYLKERFDHIVIIPAKITGPKRAVPPGVIVEESFASTFLDKHWTEQIQKLTRALFTKELYKEFKEAPKKKPEIRKLLGYVYEISRCKKWLNNYLKNHPEISQGLFYTYWFYDHTTAIALLKKTFKDIRLVSRAHGFDLYEEDYSPPYIPFRKQSLESLDALFLISDHGRKYLLQKEPSLANKLIVSRLGIEDPGFVIQRSDTEKYCLVSCSHLVPLKRLHLTIDGIACFANRHPEAIIKWCHIGDGPLMTDLKNYAAKKMPSSVEWSFAGHKTNAQVFSLYKELQPDLFLLMSTTEGLPVSIMEAFACGIPAIATNVGGISEIVNHENGILLSKDPSAEDIAAALQKLFAFPDERAKKAQNARLTWEKEFNAKKNYAAFSDALEIRS